MLVLLIALFFMLVGIDALTQAVLAALQHQVVIPLAAACLAVGIGMLKGRESSRRWGRIWAGAFLVLYLGVLAATAIVLWRQGSDSLRAGNWLFRVDVGIGMPPLVGGWRAGLRAVLYALLPIGIYGSLAPEAYRQGLFLD
jgi:divalent metal cation (Fe/Co/Zn/Cd) transporter